MHFNIAEVAVILPIYKKFLYSIPKYAKKLVNIGQKVIIPFNNRTVNGYIINLQYNSNIKELKEILQIRDERPIFPENMVPLFNWLADYYIYPVGKIIEFIIPKGLNYNQISKIYLLSKGKSVLKSALISVLEKKILSLLTKGPKTFKKLEENTNKKNIYLLIKEMEQKNWIEIRNINNSKKIKYVSELLFPPNINLSPQRKKILNYLKKNGDSTIDDIISSANTTSKLIYKMVVDKQLKTYDKSYYENQEVSNKATELVANFKLTLYQEYAVNRIGNSIGKEFKTFLLNGVTGSGKTEVYIRLAKIALAKQFTVMVLVPEIALVYKMEKAFLSHFGTCIAVIHSKLNKSKLNDSWLLILRKKVNIVIGARSCVFAPLDNLGLVIVDEEHDSSYKQERAPFYNARDVAIIRARTCNAVALLGSATPSIQSWFNVQNGKFLEISLPCRVKNKPLPKIDVVNLSRNKIIKGYERYLTQKLVRQMKLNLKQKHQTILFINRRGFASISVCMNCGEPVRCKNCDISLKLHYNHKRLTCHYCGFSEPTRTLCSFCNLHSIKSFGIGTEKIEMIVKDIFPEARVSRLDKDTTQKKGSMIKILEDFENHSIDILIGTQMITKSHDFPGVTLVGILCADLSINFPDFRSSEKTFQIISQVSGRAGRGVFPGKIILQTYNPKHFSIVSSKNQNFESFYAKEIKLRKELSYPPFSRIIQIKISGKKRLKVIEHANKIHKSCFNLFNSDKLYEKNILILGPVELPIPRLDSHYRWHIMLKGLNTEILHSFTEKLVKLGKLKYVNLSIKVSINVDPVSLM